MPEQLTKHFSFQERESNFNLCNDLNHRKRKLGRKYQCLFAKIELTIMIFAMKDTESEMNSTQC